MAEQFSPKSMLIDPILDSLDYMGRRSELPEEPLELVRYDVPDIAQVLQWRLDGQPADGGLLFSQPAVELPDIELDGRLARQENKSDYFQLLVVPMSDKRIMYVSLFEGINYARSNYSSRQALYDRYHAAGIADPVKAIYPVDDNRIAIEGFIRPPDFEEMKEGFEEPVFVTSSADLLPYVEAFARHDDYMDKHGNMKREFKRNTLKSRNQTKLQAEHGLRYLHAASDMISQAKFCVVFNERRWEQHERNAFVA